MLLLDTIYNHKPVKLQNGVGPTHCNVSGSYKCSERQYSDLLSVYAIRTNAPEEQKYIQKKSCEMCYIKFIAQIFNLVVGLSDLLDLQLYGWVKLHQLAMFWSQKDFSGNYTTQ